MALQFGFRNQTYDDAVPLYQDAPGLTPPMLWNRLNHVLYYKADLLAFMQAHGYTPGPKEIGPMLVPWDDVNDGPWNSGNAPPITPPVYKPPVMQPITGLPKTGSSNDPFTTLVFDFFGQNVPTGGKTVTIAYTTDGTPVTFNVPLAAGDTPDQATTKIMQAILAQGDFHGTKGAGTTIDLTFGFDGTVSKFTMTVA